jgi:hypothetical protein
MPPLPASLSLPRDAEHADGAASRSRTFRAPGAPASALSGILAPGRKAAMPSTHEQSFMKALFHGVIAEDLVFGVDRRRARRGRLQLRRKRRQPRCGHRSFRVVLSPLAVDRQRLGHRNAETSTGRVLIVGTVNAAADLGAGTMPFGGGIDDALIVSSTP